MDLHELSPHAPAPKARQAWAERLLASLKIEDAEG
jgi:hypothetical protein